MELRPALEGFAGIPQETRLLFKHLHSPENVIVDGLVNTFHGTYQPSGRATGALRVFEQSKFILSALDRSDQSGRFRRVRLAAKYGRMTLGALTGLKSNLLPFDAQLFQDFVWQNIFSKTLSSDSINSIVSRSFYMNALGWDVMHFVGRITRRYPVLNTQNWDIALMQTPFPGHVSSHTALIIRYHDAIPIYLPQTISNAYRHMASHFHALRMNAKRAWFACTSGPVLDDLVRLFPQIEARAAVIPDMVSEDYFPERSNIDELRILARRFRARETEYVFESLKREQKFYCGFSGHYIIAVSTIEPRKNYSRLISAWQAVNQRTKKKIQLVIVGEMGWNYEEDHRQIKALVLRGELFHLARMPSWALRKLYSNAIAVVCPSVSEGFDYSGIEGMQCNTPVIASDIPTHRAVYKDAARYFDAYSTSQLTDELERVLSGHIGGQIEHAQTVASAYKPRAVIPAWNDFFHRVTLSRKLSK